jgi:hypothetical protein
MSFLDRISTELIEGKDVISVYNDLTEVEVEQIAPILQSSKTKELKWRGRIGVKTIIKHLPVSLVKLQLNFTGIGDEEIIALSENIPPSLVVLDLSFNWIKCKGIEVLV